jgi:hypothetical protein
MLLRAFEATQPLTEERVRGVIEEVARGARDALVGNGTTFAPEDAQQVHALHLLVEAAGKGAR